MLTSSTLSINWLKPDLEEERWEFFNHPAKQEWYCSHNVSWERLASVFNAGELTPYPRSDRLCGMPVALSYHSYEEYKTFLAKAKRGYRINYSRMEDALQAAGSLVLKAPIILTSGGEAILFSGYRRLCLGWNYGILPYVWRVEMA